ncbi:MAG: alpha/beta hydrolase [Steroidobacteraceae bacterium]
MRMFWKLFFLCFGCLMLVLPDSVAAPAEAPAFKAVNIGDGIVLHYVEQGSGPTLIMIHGSISDYTYWQEQIGPFAQHYRVIAYSRRYNWPNSNPARPGYSAITDAEDLAALITKLHLGRVYVIGHSYGALTALFMAARHPQMLEAVVLAEAPAIPLLRDLSGPDTQRGKALYADIQARMVAPMRAAFARGDRERGVATFIDYVFDDPQGWNKMVPSSRADTMKDAREWDVMMTRGTLFPELAPSAIHAIHVPMLIMSGGKSYAFLGLIDSELAKLLPDNRRIIFQDAGHQMWMQHPQEARADAEAFFRSHS